MKIPSLVLQSTKSAQLLEFCSAICCSARVGPVAYLAVGCRYDPYRRDANLSIQKVTHDGAEFTRRSFCWNMGAYRNMLFLLQKMEF